MKNIKVIFRNGQLIDAENKKQIHLVPGEQYFIIGDDNAFRKSGYLEEERKPRTEQAMRAFITEKYDGFKTERILKAGDNLYFRIGLGKTTSEDKTNEYLFEAILQEDLYIRSKKGEKWRLCECMCKTGKKVRGNLPFIHEIKGNSLNNLFANVVIHYFSGKRSTACNAFTTFALPDEPYQSELPYLDWIKRCDTRFLKDLRIKVERDYLEKKE